MATTSIRGDVKTWLVDELTTLLEPVPVSYGWPGRHLERDHVWIDRVTGTVTMPFAMSGRKVRDDQFTVRLVFQSSKPGDSIAETDETVETMYGHFEDLIATDPSLEAMDGVMDAPTWTAEGPNGELTDEGAVSFYVVDLTVNSRLD